MQTPHHRKIELQSPADLSYLYTNTLAVSRQKLDLHFPPSANNDSNNDPDPMKERVRELVDEVCTYLPNRSLLTAGSFFLLTTHAPVHNPNLQNRNPGHLHKRSRHQQFHIRGISPLSVNSSAARQRNNRIRTLRRKARVSRLVSLRAAGVSDHDRRAAEEGCAR